MGNPLFQALGGNAVPKSGNDFSEFFKQLEHFKKTFTRDPRAEVQRLIESGQMSQQDFTRLGQMADQLLWMMQNNEAKIRPDFVYNFLKKKGEKI